MLEHELRRQIVTEMHLRKLPRLKTPGLIVQWVRLVESGDRSREKDLLSERISGSAGDPPYVDGQISPHARFVWERHSEGSNLAVLLDVTGPEAFLKPESIPEIAEAIRWGESFPGEVVRATRIWLAPTNSEAEELVPQSNFTAEDMVVCGIGPSARLWSDFRIQPDGYGRLIVASNNTDAGDLTRLIQKLQELGNYRNRALLGLPVAKQNWAHLNSIEDRLRTLIANVTNPEITDDGLLDQISGLSIEIASISADSNFRLSATAAYAEIVKARLAELDCQRVTGFASLVDFTERRFLPAIRTCAAMTERIDQLTERSHQFTSLLRTRIETRIEHQNGELLRSMERSADRQLRLQELVEGLSIVALSYYAVALLAYVVKPFEHLLPAGGKDAAIAAIVPLMVAGAWYLVTRLKRRVLQGHSAGASG